MKYLFIVLLVFVLAGCSSNEVIKPKTIPINNRIIEVAASEKLTCYEKLELIKMWLRLEYNK